MKGRGCNILAFALAFFDESVEEFHGFCDRGERDALVCAVDRTALCTDELDGREAIDAIGEASPMARVGAGDHQIWSDYGLGPYL